MATEITRGFGKLYMVSSAEQFISDMSYTLHEEHVIGHPEKWSGELVTNENIHLPDGDKYMICLKDERKGRCVLKRRTNRATFMVPPRYVYFFVGTSGLE